MREPTDTRTSWIRTAAINLAVFACFVFVVNAAATAALIGVSEWRRLGNLRVLEKQFAAMPNYRGREREMLQYVRDGYDIGVRYTQMGGYRSVAYHSATINIGEDGRRYDPNAKPFAGAPIALYGGSTVWGSAEIDANTLPARIATQHKVAVINEGESGYTSRNALGWMIAHLQPSYRPAAIVFYTGVNDLRACGGAGDGEDRDPSFDRMMADRKAIPGVGTAGLSRSDYGKVAAWNMFPALLLASKASANFGGNANRTGFMVNINDAALHFQCAGNPAAADRAADVMIADWQKARVLAQAAGIPFHAILQPNFYTGAARPEKIDESPELRRQYLAFYAAVRRRMAALHADWFTDLSGAFDAYPREYLYADYCHVSRRGNEILADRIMDAIKPELH